MKSTSVLNTFFHTCKIISNFSYQKSRFLLTLTREKNRLSYLNWLSKEEKTNHFYKFVLNHSNDTNGFETLSRYIDNYKKKVKDLDSRILEVESYYRSKSFPQEPLEYDIIGSYAYFLNEIEGDLCLYRTHLSNLKVLESGNNISQLILNTSEKVLNFSNLSSQGICNIKKIRVSPEGDLMCLIYDQELNDMCKGSFYHIPTRNLFNHTLKDVGDVYFMFSGKGKMFTRVYYTQLNGQRRSHKLFTSIIQVKSGRICSKRLIYSEPVNFISLFKSKNGEALFMAITSYNKVLSSYLIDGRGKVYSIPSERNSKILLEFRRPYVYIINSNLESNLTKIPVHTLKPVKFTGYYEGYNKNSGITLIQKYKQLKLDYVVTDLDMFDKGLVIYMMKPPSTPLVAILRFGREFKDINITHNKKLIKLRLRAQNGSLDENLKVIKLPLKVGAIEPRLNMTYNSNLVKFNLNSPGNPSIVTEIDLINTKINNYGKVDHNIKSFVLEVPSRDGTCKVPVTLVCRGDVEDIKHLRNRKCVLYVYGFYGENLTVCNYPEHGPLLEMGYVLGFAHVRGGGELGKIWQEMGTKQNKHNSFYDLVDVIQFLIAKNVTSRNLMAINVASASGILGGCLYNMTPDLCSVIIFKLPYLDLFTSATDPTQPLVELEQDEFGIGSNTSNKENEHLLDLIYSLDPCINVKVDLENSKKRKPALIINCDQSDSRTPWYHTAKFLNLLKGYKENVFVRLTNHGHEGIPQDHHLIRTCSEEISIIDSFLKKTHI